MSWHVYANLDEGVVCGGTRQERRCGPEATNFRVAVICVLRVSGLETAIVPLGDTQLALLFLGSFRSRCFVCHFQHSKLHFGATRRNQIVIIRVRLQCAIRAAKDFLLEWANLSKGSGARRGNHFFLCSGIFFFFESAVAFFRKFANQNWGFKTDSRNRVNEDAPHRL